MNKSRVLSRMNRCEDRMEALGNGILMALYLKESSLNL